MSDDDAYIREYLDSTFAVTLTRREWFTLASAAENAEQRGWETATAESKALRGARAAIVDALGPEWMDHLRARAASPR
jgi:hypothetical protein